MGIPLRVLIVEDSKADAMLLMMELEQGGYEVTHQRVDAPEAMNSALKQQAWDIILSDYVMPSFSGPAALKLVQELGIDLPFIMVTGQVGEETAVQMMKAGAHDYVLKGNLTRLVPAIQRELRDAVVRRERKQAEAEVSRLASIVESSDDAIIGKTLEGIITTWNQGAERLYGYSAEEAIGRSLSIIMPPDRADELPTTLERIRQGDSIEQYETVRLCKHGQPLTVSLTVSPIKDRDRRIIGASTIARDITERKRMEEALRQAHAELERRVEERTRELAAERQRLTITLRSIGDGVIVTDTQGNVTLMNELAEELTGWSERKAAGRPLAEVFHIVNEETRGILENPVEKVLSTGATVGLANNTVLVARYGAERIIADSAAPVRGEDGTTAGVVLVFRDVTKRKLAEVERERLLEEIEDQRRFLKTVIDNAPVGIALLRGSDFVFELANPAYLAIAPGKVLLGRTVAETWAELAPQVLPLLENVFRTGEPYCTVDTPLPVKRAPGRPIEEMYFTFSYVPLPDPAGQVDSILVLVTDTTEQVQARQRVEKLAREAQRRSAELQSIIDKMVEGVFVSDAEGRITLVNEAGTKLLGMDGPEEGKRALAEFPELLQVRRPEGRPVSPEEQPMVRALAGEIVAQDDLIIFNRKTRQDVYLRLSAAPIRDETGKIAGVVAVVRDVTELTDLDRLKEQFIAVAAHELKTPVAGVKGFAQLLLQREYESISPTGLKALAAINRQADRIGRLVDDLLDISQLQAGHLELTIERIDLPAFLQEVIDRMTLTAAKHPIQLVKAEPVVVQADRGRLEEVVTNLLDNAIRYSPMGGAVDVAVAMSGPEAVISVEDHGVGIPKEKQSRIFQRFYRAHTGTPYDYGGMGVGLYISKEIIGRHGGRIWFESEEGKGSTFHFALPVA